jgi:threonyl-tRNA synthetase
VQVRVLPVSEKVADYAARVAGTCRAASLRTEADLRNEKLGYKVREAQLEKIPVIVVVGEREAAAGTVAPRTGSGEPQAVPLDAFIAETVAAARMPGGVP